VSRRRLAAARAPRRTRLCLFAGAARFGVRRSAPLCLPADCFVAQTNPWYRRAVNSECSMLDDSVRGVGPRPQVRHKIRTPRPNKLTIIGSRKMANFHQNGSLQTSRFRIPIFSPISPPGRKIHNIHACSRMREISSRSKKWIWSEFSISGLALSGTYYLTPKRAKLVGMVGFSTLLDSEEGTHRKEVP
jgi:hypothetical protein